MLDEVFEALKPTLMKLMDHGLIGGALAVMSVHAEDVGRDILEHCGEILEGTVL